MEHAVTPSTEELETARRLRASLGRLARLLRRTDAGTSADLTPTRVSVLLAADRRGPIRLSEVADREGINPTLLSRAVAHLVAEGVLERTADPEDRRSAWLQVTARGHEIAVRIRQERTEAVLTGIQTLSRQDRERLWDALPALEHLAEWLAEERP